jgi:RNA-binding protein 39
MINLNVDEFYQFFSGFGEITDFHLVKDPKTGNSRGFGFIMFKNSTIADYLCYENCFYIKGKKLYIKHAENKTKVLLEKYANDDIAFNNYAKKNKLKNNNHKRRDYTRKIIKEIFYPNLFIVYPCFYSLNYELQ